MEYNKCSFCGASDGRCGLMIESQISNNKPACINCHDTLKSGEIVIHSNLNRTEEEIKKTMSLI